MHWVFRTNLVLLALALFLLNAPDSAGAAEENEGDFDRLDRVTLLQEQAVAAVKARDWERAREFAEIVLTLDDSEFTAPSRLVLIRALEGEGNYAAALYELGQYTSLSISPSAARRAERIELRLQKLKSGERQVSQLRSRAPLGVKGSTQRPAAVAMLLGGLAATVTGSYFIGTDIFWSGQDVTSGTWAVIGTPLLVVGVGLD
ncbi:MAG: hypothetical protein VX498_02610, partial [Myxococcota bacterium]|nr:hypothetical protein [Myxococcota bacterium]